MTLTALDEHASDGTFVDAVDEPRPEISAPDRRRRYQIIAGVTALVWLRVGLILSSPAFETPDTASYRSGQGTRPPVSAALLSWLGDTTYVLLSAIVSTAGFVALGWVSWDRRRPYVSMAIVAALGVISMSLAVLVYEHWLVPDSLLLGLSLLGLAVVWRQGARLTEPRRHATAAVGILGLCMVMTLTKEAGFGVVILLAGVLLVLGAWRIALAAVLVCGLLFATVILPVSDQRGQVLWNQPEDTQLTMERFRVMVSGLMWSDLSPELAEVNERAAACGITPGRLVRETFLPTDRMVDFGDCDGLWAVVDDMSQLDVLIAHARNPIHTADSVERGFVPDLTAMAVWGESTVQSSAIISADRWVAAAIAVLPVVALVVALARRRGRALALIAMVGSVMALFAVLVDPSGQDRHSIGFRVLAACIALLALTVATHRGASGSSS